MKTTAYILAGALLFSGITSCDDSHKPDWSETAPVDVNVVSTSIANGATVSASTGSITVEYSTGIVLNPAVGITLSGGSIESVEVNDNKLTASFNLSKGKTYVFNIPSRAVAGIGTKTFAPETTVTFSTEGASMIIDSSLLTRSLTNPNATAEAQKVFNVLLDNYGTKQLSGAMGEVAWSTQFTDLIHSATGEYPAIIGFDYIHLASSPADWINYGDITPVKNAWEAGSIPTITWHWNVPKSQDDPSLGYDASSDAFNAANVLIDGTWENTVATADVKKVAGYLKLLQDAGIPVLWRPFHEAAGDYTWGSWFWWGNSGVETTKQLWSWLREKLTVEYGLNNLIWVWTVQTSDEGKPASMTKISEAYPGDDLVDIVGADLYVDPLTNQTSQFEILYNLVKGKKLVALTECGNLLDVESALADGALWSYFMGWYDLDDNGKPAFGEWNTNNEWKTVMDNPLVINRGDVTF